MHGLKLMKMDDNLKRILKEFEELKGQFVISGFDIQRLIAIGDDGEDYYYILWNGKRTLWTTCVGSIVPLKGYIKDVAYKELVRIAKLNDNDSPFLWDPQTDEAKEEVLKFNKQAKEEVENQFKNGDKLIAGIFWDII